MLLKNHPNKKALLACGLERKTGSGLDLACDLQFLTPAPRKSDPGRLRPTRGTSLERNILVGKDHCGQSGFWLISARDRKDQTADGTLIIIIFHFLGLKRFCSDLVDLIMFQAK